MQDPASQPLRFVSVKLSPVGRAQSFVVDDGDTTRVPRTGEQVIVQTENGPAIGTVTPLIPQIAARRPGAADPSHRLVRLASHEDIIARLRHQQREEEAYRFALLRIRERGMAMKLTRVEQALDGSRLLFYFTADARVDFRQPLLELAAEFRPRIEMRPIGARDQAKALGRYGTCCPPLR